MVSDIDLADARFPLRPSRALLGVAYAVGAALAACADVAHAAPFTPAQTLSANATRYMAVGDLTGDDRPDVVFADRGTSVFDAKVGWSRNLGGTFAPKRTIDIASGVSGIGVGDMDGDDDLDIVVAHVDAISWLQNADGAGSFAAPVLWSDAPEQLTSMILADIDGDGDDDVVFGDRQTDGANLNIVWLENGQAASAVDEHTVFSGLPISDVRAADLDRDGDLDLISGSSTGWSVDADNTIGWHENEDGGGAFGSRTFITDDLVAVHVYDAADVNGDGLPDIVAGIGGSGGNRTSLGWYPNENDAASFGAQRVVQINDQLEGVASADFDRDGDLDFTALTEDAQTRRRLGLAFYQQLPDGTFDRDDVFDEAKGDRSYGGIAADLDGDEFADVLVSAKTVRWFRNTANDPTAISAAVLPSGRSAQTGNTVSAFVTLINGGTVRANDCTIAVATAIPAAFAFRTTDPATNVVVGAPNEPVDIAPGGAQSFAVFFDLEGTFAPTDVEFVFRCLNAEPAPVIPGVNTLLLSSAAQPVPDIVALAQTTSGLGIVDLVDEAQAGAFSVATVNVGAGADLLVAANTGVAGLPVVMSLCQTAPSGACINPTTAQPGPIAVPVGAGETQTFSVFVSGLDDVPFDPARNRIFVAFSDTGGLLRGQTSVAVRNIPWEPPDPIVDVDNGIDFRVRRTAQDGVVEVRWTVGQATLNAGAAEFTIQLYVGGGQQWFDQVSTAEPTDNNNPVNFGGVGDTFCFRMIGTTTGGDAILGSGTSGNRSPCS